MRRHAKAATAVSVRQKAARFALPASLFAALLALLVVVGSASATKTHLFKEAFGTVAQPSFASPRGMAIDQGTGEVYVIDAGSPPSLKRYNADGTASSFGALSSNVIDGAGGADATPQGSLVFGAANRVQIAIDESSTATDGNIYVAQASTKLVDVFDSTGTYKGQLTESSEGLMGEVCGVAVDPSGKLYVGDIAGKIHVYAPAANPPVKADNSANFATLASPCQIAAGTGPTAGFVFVNRSTGELKKVDAATGEVKYTIGSGSFRTVYVNPGTGHLYAPRLTGTGSEVVEYDASGIGSAAVVSSLRPGSTIEGIAVKESTGDIFLTRSGQSQAQVYGPTVTQPEVTTTAVSSNTGVHATLNGTVNPDGVELSECKFEWSLSTGNFGSTAPCAESNAAIGAGASPVAVHADLSGLAPQGVGYKFRLVAKNATTPAVTGSEQNFTTPQTVIATGSSGVTSTSLTLNGTVNPDGATISECQFEWGVPKASGEGIQKYPNVASCVPGPGGITGTSPVAVHANLSGLSAGTPYVFRLKAGYPTGTVINVFGGTVQTAGPAIEATWTEGVTFSEAELKAQINPKGSATTYRFEYGKTEAYGQETEALNVGSDSSPHVVARPLNGLEPGTNYHYRAIATSGAATSTGPDRTFRTYRTPELETDCPNQAVRYGPSAALPDCRAYEMVSPVDKAGQALRQRPGLELGYLESFRLSTADGNQLTYASEAAFGDIASSQYVSQYIATRGPEGWTNHGLNFPQGPTVNDPGFTPEEQTLRFQAFTPDLSTTWVADFNKAPLFPGGRAGVENYYRYQPASNTGQALTSTVPLLGEPAYNPSLAGFAKDGSRAFFDVPAPLTANAAMTTKMQVYEMSGGEPELISILPGGGANPNSSFVGTAGEQSRIYPQRTSALDHAISDDGSRVFWTSTTTGSDTGGPGRIFVRIDGETTVPVSESVTTANAQFWTAAADGSKALFSYDADPEAAVDQHLYEFDVESETPTLIATKVAGVVAASDDLSRIYFVSEEQLAPDAVSGERNLYLDDGGTIVFIATLANAEANLRNNTTPIPLEHAARTTPTGNRLLFISPRSLTGYDNTDTATGKAAVEVYAYDAESDELICISCKPNGARPTGEFLSRPHSAADFPLVGPFAAWPATWETSLNELHVMSDDGDRVFFNASDALVPQDTNGVQDLYQWEAPGKGGCDAADSDYSPRNGGCISLISTGQSPKMSEFVEASPDGQSVFFETESSIVPQDPGTLDLYVARADGGFARAAAPNPCVGDACQSAPPVPGAPTAASAEFRGAGNPSPTARQDCGAVARRARQLRRRAEALRAAAKGSSEHPQQARKLRLGSAQFARKAKALGKRATHCRRANRRAGR